MTAGVRSLIAGVMAVLAASTAFAQRGDVAKDKQSIAAQDEMLQRKIEEAMRAQDLSGALDLFAQYRALPQRPTSEMLLKEAKAAMAAGQKKRAAEALALYIDQTVEDDPEYMQAVDLFEKARKP